MLVKCDVYDTITAWVVFAYSSTGTRNGIGARRFIITNLGRLWLLYRTLLMCCGRRTRMRGERLSELRLRLMKLLLRHHLRIRHVRLKLNGCRIHECASCALLPRMLLK